MPQVFVSYSTKNAVFADLTLMRLGALGISVWLDSGDLKGGEEWRRSIDNGIAGSDAMIVLLTPESCASSYVTYEWGYALGMGKKVIPILHENCDIHPRLEAIQHLDFRDHRNAPWTGLADEIKSAAKEPNLSLEKKTFGQMNANDLKEIFTSVMALASADSKSNSKSASESEFSSAAESVIGAVSNPALHGPNKKSRTILWVDDRPDNNVYERRSFGALGIKFELALSTKEALEALSEATFAAIISDMGRKEGAREGYVLLEALRKTDSETPFFIYAGSNSPEHKQEALERGAQGSTSSPQELFNTVIQHL